MPYNEITFCRTNNTNTMKHFLRHQHKTAECQSPDWLHLCDVTYRNGKIKWPLQRMEVQFLSSSVIYQRVNKIGAILKMSFGGPISTDLLQMFILVLFRGTPGIWNIITVNKGQQCKSSGENKRKAKKVKDV